MLFKVFNVLCVFTYISDCLSFIFSLSLCLCLWIYLFQKRSGMGMRRVISPDTHQKPLLPLEPLKLMWAWWKGRLNLVYGTSRMAEAKWQASCASLQSLWSRLGEAATWLSKWKHMARRSPWGRSLSTEDTPLSSLFLLHATSSLHLSSFTLLSSSSHPPCFPLSLLLLSPLLFISHETLFLFLSASPHSLSSSFLFTSSLHISLPPSFVLSTVPASLSFSSSSCPPPHLPLLCINHLSLYPPILPLSLFQLTGE